MVENVLDWLDATAGALPDKIAFDDTEGTLSFSALREEAKRIASGLLRHTRPRQVVAVLAGRCALTPAIYLSAVCAGCCYAPLDSEAPRDRLLRILENTRPCALLADREHWELARELAFDGPVLSVEELRQTPIDEENLARIRACSAADDPLYIIFTSGSSGVPKGVITSQESLIHYLDAYASVVGIDREDILGCQSPLSYIAAIRDIYLPIRCGASTVIIPKKLFSLPKKLFALLNEKRVSAIGWSVSAFTLPTSLGVFKTMKPETLRKISFSGSVMPCRCLRVWQEALPEARFVHQYGPTETTASCSYYVVDHVVSDDEVLPIGTPYRNYRMFLLNEDNTPTEPGKLGEICVGGPCVTLGYYRDKTRTEAAFLQNPLHDDYRDIVYKTGDLGRLREDGLFEFHGRKDRQIKHFGHRVELDELEECAKGAEGIRECAALYYAEKEQITLFYCGEATDRRIATYMREKLPGFMVPRRFVRLDEMPRLSNGKTDMQSLRKNYFT